MYKHIYAPAFLGAVFVFLIGGIAPLGCANVSVETIKNAVASSPAAAAYIEGVPFYPQKESLCGPAAVASVVGYFKTAVSMEDAAKAVYDERWKGALPIDLVIFAKEMGFGAEFYKGSLLDLKKHIRAKTPLILFIDAGYGILPLGHYIVATGYSDEFESITAHSGMTRDAVFSYAELLRAWQRTGYSAILLSPLKHVPE